MSNSNSRFAPPISRRHATEKKVADTLLGDFNPVESRGFKILTEIVGTKSYGDMSRNMLLSVTNILSYLIHETFPRNFSRRKALIIKWFDMYADRIEPLKDIIRVDFKENYNENDMKEDDTPEDQDT